MSPQTPPPVEKIRQSFARYAAPGIVLVYQLLALLLFASIPLLASAWLRLPFIGGFVEHTMIVTAAGSAQGSGWQLYEQNPAFGHVLAAVDGAPVSSAGELAALLANYQPGETVDVTLHSPQGEDIVREIRLGAFSPTDRAAFLYIPFIIGLIYLISSIWVFGLRRQDDAGRAFSIFATSVAIATAALFDTFTTHRLTPFWTAAIALIGGSLFHLALVFPQPLAAVERRPIYRLLGYAPAIGLIAAALPTLYDVSRPQAYILLWRLEYIYAGLAAIFFFGMSAVRRFTSQSPIAREQVRLLWWGSAFAFSPIAIWFLITAIQPTILFNPALLLPIAIFPVVTAYTILRYRLLNTDYLLSRAVLYTLMVVLAATGYALLVSGLVLIAGGGLAINNPYALGAITFLIAILLYPLRTRLQAAVDALFSRRLINYQEQLQKFGRDLTQALELQGILDLVQKTVMENLSPYHLHIFIYDPPSGHYLSATWQQRKPSSDLFFTANSALVQTLARQRSALFLGDSATLPAALHSEQARLALLGANLYAPLPGRNRLAGWLALAPRKSGEAYTGRDLVFLEAVSDQAALAIERAQVVADLERRVHEMNILTRVSQGINVTVAFDDMLELIYAQTNQIIPTRDCCITLKDGYSQILYHVFYLENDERLNEKETKSLPLGLGLEYEVVKSRRPIVTDDYERECRGRGAIPALTGIYAWVGAPLNAGAETIGVLSLGSRNATLTYTPDQVNLLQAIADQGAGAIVKARLLQESERRTRQLTSLNEVARSLSSTLELDPLLQQILYSAQEILNCEAGSLLLIDFQTDELVFEVATGPVGKDLVGKRLPAGAGLVGRAVTARQPIIANDARQRKDWFEKPDEQTGFTTKDLLVVPMVVKDRVIGVIEVINRKDSLPFTPDDQELLAAFTSQAAVAIENARLYTQTDQTLAARVEELSVMQRIDRELNASLDVSRAMRITLEWAMRQSAADAGLVGALNEQGVRVMASQGYTQELAAYSDNLLPLTMPALAEAIASGQPQRRQRTPSDGAFSLLAGAAGQMAVPLRREDQTIGVLFLETNADEAPSDETLAFLSRLCDHAAIAIANAQLYGEVQAANQAKSDFVSFVSHELKTPMTSIRGFTDLLASGVVGSVNENQANFLRTIRSNVDRMATLVSDLADASRIEAGRLRLEFQAVEVADIVDEVVRSARNQIAEKEHELALTLPDKLPAMWGDRVRVIQVLTNLVSNACKYTPAQGKITIAAEACDNRWDSEGARRVIHLSVQDNGLGISPEDQAKIFQKFFRAEDQKVRDAPGTGLGLNITRTLVEMQGGRIWFESEYRRGSTFHFTIPVVEAA